MTWLIFAISLVGTIANIYRKRWGFILWAITNAAWAMHNFIRFDYAQTCLFSVYFVLAVWGYFAWGRE